MGYRFSIISILLVGAYTLLGFHLYQLQLVKGGYYLARADTEVEAAEGTSGNRGSIYFTDSQGNLLPAAIEQEFPIIYAVPTAIADPQEAANTVGPILGLPVAQLVKTFSIPNDSYEPLVHKADPAIAQKITDL